jgi:hypothetical protein
MPPSPSAPGPWRGKGSTLHEAVQDAANKAKDEHGAGEYTVDEIKVDIVNPIREYRVVLRA